MVVTEVTVASLATAEMALLGVEVHLAVALVVMAETLVRSAVVAQVVLQVQVSVQPAPMAMLAKPVL